VDSKLSCFKKWTWQRNLLASTLHQNKKNNSENGLWQNYRPKWNESSTFANWIL